MYAMRKTNLFYSIFRLKRQSSLVWVIHLNSKPGWIGFDIIHLSNFSGFGMSSRREYFQNFIENYAENFTLKMRFLTSWTAESKINKLNWHMSDTCIDFCRGFRIHQIFFTSSQKIRRIHDWVRLFAIDDIYSFSNFREKYEIEKSMRQCTKFHLPQHFFF